MSVEYCISTADDFLVKYDDIIKTVNDIVKRHSDIVSNLTADDWKGTASEQYIVRCANWATAMELLASKLKEIKAIVAQGTSESHVLEKEAEHLPSVL